MVIDTSALIAVLTAEPETEWFVAAITDAPTRLLASPSYLEAAMVLLSKRGPDGVVELNLVITQLKIEVVAFTSEHAQLAVTAFQRFGKGRRGGASLNFGDCFTYALARQRDEPVLFKGDDFSATDLTPAI